MNAFYLVGRIIEEPEKLETASGIKLCKLRVAVEKNGKDAGETYEVYEIVMFRSLAEENYEVGQYLAVNGKLQANNYEKDGNYYYNAKLLANSVAFVGS
ncbi:MAG: single-stranded DNA-binding protein [Erysipelotrichaceae bacterium]|nr:single-stranded DNA-binding protein [Erysipelotrichaceae bacterium]